MLLFQTMFWYIFCAVIGVIVYFKLYKPHQHWKKRNVVHFQPLPFVGNMGAFAIGRESLFHVIKKLYDETEGRYCGFYQFLKPMVLIKDIDLVKNITIKDFEHFVDHENFFSESKEPIFSENLFSSRGQDWRELRATLSPAFTGSKMRSMFTLIAECAEKFTDHFVQKAQNNFNNPIEIELKDIYRRFTIDVIGTCAYGVESNSLKEGDNFYEMSKDVGDFSGAKGLKAIGFMIIPKIMRFFKARFFSKDQVNFFLSLVTNTISFREKNKIIRPDLLHLMMEARKGKLKYEESGKIDDTGFATVAESDIGKTTTSDLKITDNLICAQAMIFFLGGTDTTSSLLCFVSHELAINEDVQKRLQYEIDDANKKCNGKSNYDIISRLKYLDMVISESLRKWPQGYLLDRLCVKDYMVPPISKNEKPLVIKKGENILISVVGMHHDPKYYPDPERFDPERFSEENKGNINAATYIPFGAGPRSCIGNRFALMVVKTILFYFLSKFDVVCTKKTKVPLQLSKSQVLLNASQGFWFGFKLRQ